VSHTRILGALIAKRRLLGVLAVGALVALPAAPAAQAAEPHWQVESRSVPSYIVPGAGEEQIRDVVLNLGGGNVAPPVTITDKLPAGLVATEITLRDGSIPLPIVGDCQPLPALSCTWTKTPPFDMGAVGREILPPYQRLEVLITVKVEAGENAPKTGEQNEVKVQGGNTSSATLAEPITVSTAPVPFGVEKYELKAENEDGSPDTQAGDHPFQLTTILNFDQTFTPKPTPTSPTKPHPDLPDQVKDLKFDIPAGLVARASAVPQCSTAKFTEVVEAGQGNLNGCAPNTAVGVASVTYFSEVLNLHTEIVPVFNLVPQGEPARFGFEVSNVHVFLDTSVRTGENYGAVVRVTNASTAVEVLGSDVSIWGTPGAPSHDIARGWECLDDNFYEEVDGTFIKPCQHTGQENSPAFLTLPTTCSSQAEARETTVTGDSWPTTFNNGGVIKEEHKLEGAAEQFLMPTLTGCEKLHFDPEMTVQPDANSTSSPTGLNVDVKIPQEGILAEKGLAEADVKETTVALPEQLQANPGAANGLEACPATGEHGAGFNGFESGLGESAQLENDHFTSQQVTCPEASKVGKVTIKTPLLASPLSGFVYLAEQDTNPFASPLVLYLVAEDPVSKVLVKLAGEVKIEPSGQLVSVFRNTPPQPFEELNLEFFDGQGASQATPAQCGSYETKASFVTWSGETVQRNPSFKLEHGPHGSNCPGGALPFSPIFQAGTTVNEAGQFTPFTLTIGRPDGEQGLKSITMRLPPGLAAILASVTRCAEPASGQEWACGPESEIGQSTAVSGLGGDPVTLPGKAYLAGPYKGAPFSIVDVTPANAGPFHLGNVVVRSKIDVDRNTAAATITSDELPQFVKGVPSQLKELNVTVDRSHFEFNPTNCAEMKIKGTLTGYEGGSDEVSSAFQVANCASLPFHPEFTASTSAQTSKTNGASLNVKINYPAGIYANVEKSVTDLPYALPSRLTTIQKACPDTVFESNPASCDEGSVIGEGIVHTPVFKNPLVGPAYLVSHGNRAFPDLEIVLQGEGITLVLDGNTDIKKGITKTTFETVPDAPVETFELNLPEGPHSALAANGNLCKPGKVEPVREKVTKKVHGHTIHVTKTVSKMVPEALVIPTTLTAQNGRVLEQQTRIAVTGCSKAKPKAKAAKKAKKAKKSSKKK